MLLGRASLVTRSKSINKINKSSHWCHLSYLSGYSFYTNLINLESKHFFKKYFLNFILHSKILISIFSLKNEKEKEEREKWNFLKHFDYFLNKMETHVMESKNQHARMKSTMNLCESQGSPSYFCLQVNQAI
jgi:hypothetical protein